MSLNQKQETEVIKQAVTDRDSGKFTEYKGSTLQDVVYAPLNKLSGDASSHEIAEEKQALYNQVRSR